MTLRSLLVFTAVALLSAGPEAAEVSWEIDPVPRALQWAPDGPILEFVEHDGILYLAGTFDYVGRPTGSIGRFDVSSGEVDLDLPKTDGEVYVIARDGMGGWIVGGEFARVGSAARSNLARFDSQWQLTDWAPLVNAPVWCIEVDGNDVYLGGEFFSISGIERRYVARLDLSTGQVHAWSPTATSPPQNFDVVRAILVSGDVVYFGGDFETIIGGQERRHLAAVHADTGALLAFDANPDGAVFSLEEHSSGVVAAGNFDVIGGKLRKRLAVVDPVTGVAQGLDVSFSSDVLTTELDGDVLYCGGIFAEVAGLSRSRAAAIDLVGGAVLPWNPTLTGTNGVSLEDLEVTSNSVLLAGRFHEVSGQPRRHLAEVSKTTGLPTALAVGASGPPNLRLRAVVRDSSTITVAGDFRILGLEVRRGFAAIDLETEDLLPLAPTFTDMNSGLSESVRALAFCGGSIFVGGTFDHVNGILHPRLAKIDASTGALDPTFDLGFPFNAGIPGPLACDGKLLLMGVYTPSTAGSGVSAWDASTGALRWRIKTNSALRDIVF